MSIVDGWFREVWKGLGIAIQVEEILFQKKSQFQDILVFKRISKSVYGSFAKVQDTGKTCGTVLALDGTVQLTEKDEFAYHETIAHVPLNCHPDPKRVLIIGGGDGGVAREVAKDSRVQQIVLCEIDQEVLEVCRQYLPTTACGLDHPKVRIIVEDGYDFLANVEEEYDVIITDSCDLTENSSPSEVLFQGQYFELVRKSLRPGGIMCSQGLGLWVDMPLVLRLVRLCRNVFPSVSYAQATVPSYIGGGNGFVLCSHRKNVDFSRPSRILSQEEVEKHKLRYYNSFIHATSFILPQKFKQILSDLG